MSRVCQTVLGNGTAHTHTHRRQTAPKIKNYLLTYIRRGPCDSLTVQILLITDLCFTIDRILCSMLFMPSERQLAPGYRWCTLVFFFNLADPRGITYGGLPGFPTQLDIFRRWCQGLIRPQVPCTPSLHCPIANSASTQSQQPV